MQLPHWEQSLTLNPSLVDHNPGSLHQVYSSHFPPGLLLFLAITWLWVLPDLRSWKPTWCWESLLSRNPAHTAVPIFLSQISPLRECCWPRVTWSLPHLHGLADLMAQLFPRRSSGSWGFSQHCHFLAQVPWSCLLECPSMPCSSDCELWHMTERILELEGILKIILGLPWWRSG